MNAIDILYCSMGTIEKQMRPYIYATQTTKHEYKSAMKSTNESRSVYYIGKNGFLLHLTHFESENETFAWAVLITSA